MFSATGSTMSLWGAAVAFNAPPGGGVNLDVMQALHWLLVGIGWAVVLLLGALRLIGVPAGVFRLGPMRASRMQAEMIVLPFFVFLVASWAIYPVMDRAIGSASAATSAPTTAPATQPSEVSPRDRMVSVAVNNAAMIFGAAACYLIGRRFIGTTTRTFFVGDRQYGRFAVEGLLGALAAIAVCYTVLTLTQWGARLISPELQFPEHNVINVMRDAGAPPWMPALLWFGAVIATPLAEEMFFRGLLQTTFGHYLKNRGLAIVLTGVLFGFAHMSQWHVVPAIALFGMILGLLYERTGSLVAPVLAHAIFNAKTMLWVTLAADGKA